MAENGLPARRAAQLVWIYDSEYRRQYQTAVARNAVARLRQRFGGFKALVPCEELVVEARQQGHHLHGLYVNPRELA